jgi:prepilin-type N-terminal cleavage/methylation domain-containing protein
MRRRTGQSGFSLVEIMIVVSIIAILATLALPHLGRARSQAWRKACIEILRSIDGAKQQWALENCQPVSAVPVSGDLNLYIKGGTGKCVCPRDPGRSFGTSYEINSLSESPTCKIIPGSHVY